ncbi:hypothetical protein TRVA0_013S03114 [Trichomonascus vanleenenianus]|uniref:uncharacterized protein n=1 Tax=Trichomonascus vanleenenianus TaxID=2268995 RepID=UPI003EC9DC5A
MSSSTSSSSAGLRSPRQHHRPSSSLSSINFAASLDEQLGKVPSGPVSVNVAVRIKPQLGGAMGPSVVDEASNKSVTVYSQPNSGSKKRYIFDAVFDPSTTQVQIWNYVEPCISKLIQGFNVTIMAYGQSGSGKSYTMGTSGTPGSTTSEESMGVTARAATALFAKLASPSSGSSGYGANSPVPFRARPPSFHISPKNQLLANALDLDKRPWNVSVTYVEIYNEQLIDLLNPQENTKIAIREDSKGGIWYQGLKEVVVENFETLLAVLDQGSTVRQTNSTDINAQSSRSHAIFTIQLTQKHLNESTGIVTTLTSKLNLVDLAGSERIKNTGASNEGRVKEGISINSGLSSLGKVISQLSLSPTSHISYRDSKLTRALQDSLGGKALTYLIACITTEELYLSETLNTLTYAQRARSIQLTPEIQTSNTKASREEMARTIDNLQREIQFWKSKAVAVGSASTSTCNSPLAPALADGQFSSTPTTPVRNGGSVFDFDFGSVESAKERITRSTAFQSAVESIIHDYEQTIQSLQESISVSRSANDELNALLSQKDAQLHTAEATNHELESLIEQLQSAINSFEQYETAAAGHDDRLIDGRCDSNLESELSQLKSELKAFRLEQKRHVSESQYLTSQYNNARKDVLRLSREKKELEEKLRKYHVAEGTSPLSLSVSHNSQTPLLNKNFNPLTPVGTPKSSIPKPRRIFNSDPDTPSRKTESGLPRELALNRRALSGSSVSSPDGPAPKSRRRRTTTSFFVQARVI